MRIDAHQHFTPEFTPALLFPILKRNRFEAGVLVSEPQSAKQSQWALALAAEHEFIRAVVCWAEPGDLDDYQTNPKFRGVTGRSVDPAELVRRSLTLDMAPDFAAIARTANQFPALRIAIDHVGRPSLMEGRTPEQLAALARYPNVFVKLSGLITDAPTQWKAEQFAPWARAAIGAFGAERVMFGSDWPSYLPAGTWKEALAAFTQAIGPQTLETREHLLGSTARKFYGVPRP